MTRLESALEEHIRGEVLRCWNQLGKNKMAQGFKEMKLDLRSMTDALKQELKDEITHSVMDNLETVQEVGCGHYSGQTWNDAEECKLVRAFKSFKNTCAERHGRSAYAIECRLEKLRKEGRL